VAEKAYELRLWRNRPGVLARIRDVDPVASGVTDWFDVDSSRASLEKMIRLVERYGDGKTGIQGYSLELIDPVTREIVHRITPSEHDLAMLRDGTSTAAGMPRSSVSLADVSDEALVGELARRLRERVLR
jgi:hypothetical protein